MFKRATCSGIHVLLYALLLVVDLHSFPSIPCLALYLQCTLRFLFVSCLLFIRIFFESPSNPFLRLLHRDSSKSVTFSEWFSAVMAKILVSIFLHMILWRCLFSGCKIITNRHQNIYYLWTK
jgi:hypothetical protein